MAIETIPNATVLKEAFEQDIYSSDGGQVKFGSLFSSHQDSHSPEKVLVIFVRHFFCGNCQEYVRRLSAPESPFHPSRRSIIISSAGSTTNFSKPAPRPTPSVILIGPGLPSLISSYTDITTCPFPVYADPSSRLYAILGMHRTLALGHKAPEYIQHSLVSGAVKSAWQAIKRVGSGDAMGGGDWHVNGGEFLFVRRATGLGSSPSPTWVNSALGSQVKSLDWEVSWCHRMLNSRDHTELPDLQYHTCASISSAGTNARVGPLARSVLVHGKTHSLTDLRPGSYSSQCRGPCPGPDIPRSRDEVLLTHASQRPPSRLQNRPRSRRTSSSTHRADIPPFPIRSRTSSQSDLRAPSELPFATQPQMHTQSPIEEDEEPSPRKSFSANIADRVGVLVRAKSFSTRSARSGTKKSMGGIFRTATGTALPADSRQRPRSRAARASRPAPDHSHHTRETLRSPSQSGAPPISSLTSSSQTSPIHKRTRTFSFSKPSLSKGTAHVDDSGIMLVNGVEFVNVISVKARIERVDSGIGSVARGHVEQEIESP